MDRSLIQVHTSALVRGLIGEWEALKSLEQTTVKGSLRELFVSRLLSKFLTSQFGVGSGVIVNQVGKTSPQIDIIIYDRRILPPFMEEQNLGAYPIESVLAAIEVRSKVDTAIIRMYAESTAELYNDLYNPDWSYYNDYSQYLPFYCLVGFGEDELFGNKSFDQIWSWMSDNAKPLFGVCVINKLSWLHVCGNRGALHMVDSYNEETKSFMAILLDNIRTRSQQRYLRLMKEHIDWLGIYTRDQAGMKKIFEDRESRRLIQGKT